MRDKMQKYRGFTLIELLLFMGLFSVLLVVVGSLFSSLVQQQLETKAYSSVEQDTYFILARLEHDLNRAQNIVLPASAGDTSNILQLIIDGDTYQYRLVENSLTLEQSTIENLNSPDTTVSNLTFTRLGTVDESSAVRIQMTLTSTTVHQVRQEQKQIDTVIGLR